jgi:hypothetical protein
VELAVVCLVLRIDKLEGVRAVAVQKTVAVRGASVREQEHDLVSGLRAQRDEVPEHVRVLQVCRRVPLLGVDEAGEQQWVPDEEYGCVVAHQIPHTLLGVELDGKAARVARRVRRAALAADGAEAHCQRRPLADLRKDVRLGVLGDVVRHLKVAKCTWGPTQKIYRY